MSKAPTLDDPARIHLVLQQFRVLLRSIKRHYRNVERQSGLAGAQVWALSEIAANPDLTVSDLARRLAIHLSTASNLVGSLEDVGLVTRARTERDRRVVRLRITPTGRASIRRAPGPPVGLLQQALLDLPSARLDALSRELDVLLVNIKRRDVRGGGAPLSDLWSAETAQPNSAVGRRTAVRKERAIK